MRRMGYVVAVFVAFAVGLVAGVANAQARPPRTITIDSSTNYTFTNPATFGTPTDAQNVNATAPTAGTVTRVAGDIVSIQCDVAVYVYVPGTATALNGELVPATHTYTTPLPAGDATLSFLPVSGAAACTHWKMVAP